MSLKLNTLVIISIPFQRLIRSHLSPLFLDFISRQAMVAVVSPFGWEPEFIDQHKWWVVQHVVGPSENDVSWFGRKLINISTLLRMQGYYFRHRSEIPYYWANRHTRFRENGCRRRYSLFHRLILDFLALIGNWRRAWQLFDRLHANSSYRCPALSILANGYDKVILIQASSWGFQDAALAFLARKEKWRTVLIPYTTDQLFCNGYLFSDYNAVCVQGNNEDRWARKFHQVSEPRIVKLGSVYMRVLRSIKADRVQIACYSGSRKRRIMYAGLIPTYFPEMCEIEAVDIISQFIIDKLGDEWELVYRPARSSKNSLLNIISRLKYPDKVLVEVPAPSALGMDTYVKTNALADVQNVVDLLSNIELLVTSNTTSLSLEAAIFGIPTISFSPEENGTLRSQQTDLLFSKGGRPLIFESVPVAKNLNDMIKLVDEVLSSVEMQQEIVKSIIGEWDYPDADFEQLLDKAVFGKSVVKLV